MPFAIRAENISKRFFLKTASHETGFPGYRTLREGLNRAALAPLRLFQGRKREDSSRSTFWALKEVSFQVDSGEVVGIVGRNGAGKSTLLKILSRISRPTRGRATIRGHVGTLLEVGTSFHPELTGRENIFLNAAILGMSRREIKGKFDAITDFAEIDRFLDTPVKRYSSGMFIRLAFSVAAHLEPEVLLIDEVLAVGDAAFQKKCLGRMGQSATAGRTVLFVSHNMAALQSLCSRVIWIDKGRLVKDGPVDDVLSAYMKTSFSPSTERCWHDRETAPGNEQIRLRRACIRPREGDPEQPITIRTPLVAEFEYWNLKDNNPITLNLHVCSEQGQIAFRTATVLETNWEGKPFPAGLFRSRVEIPGDLLNNGTHYLELFFRKNEGLAIYSNDSLLTFEVRDDASMRGSCHGTWPGAVRPNLHWITDKLDA